MINGFLDVSRLESGKMLVDKTKFDITELIAEMIDEVQLTTQGQIYQAVTRGQFSVSADRDKIGSVITNLLTNAVKYSPAGGDINVDCVVKGDEMEVSIKDKGIGACPEDLEKLFERYYRVESLETRRIAGFGIGLYLSSEIIKQHHGRIWAESELGMGSTFYFSLPLNQ